MRKAVFEKQGKSQSKATFDFWECEDFDATLRVKDSFTECFCKSVKMSIGTLMKEIRLVVTGKPENYLSVLKANFVSFGFLGT